MMAILIALGLGGAAILLSHLLRSNDSSRIKWPLDVYVEERRRWVQALNRTGGIGRREL